MGEQSKAGHSLHNETGVRHLLQDLNREDSRLRARLLDAAIAGLRLSRDPQSIVLRQDVAQIWAAMEPVLSHHLDTEDSQVLPWLKEHKKITTATLDRIRERHQALRKLMSVMEHRTPDAVAVEDARNIGKSLAALAVALDDAIDDEERRLLPTLRKALYESLG